MPSRTVSRETSTPFGAAFHSNRRYGPRITGATRQQGACLARRVRRMDRMALDTDVSRETPGRPPVLEIGLGATPFWPVIRRDGRNWLRHHPRPPGHVGSGACFRQVRESSPPSSPDPSRYEALARSPRPPQMLVPRPVCVSMQSRGPRSVRAPTPGARAWTWAIRHTQAPPLRVPIGDRDSHHGARPPGGNAHPCRLPCPCLSPLHPPSSPAPRQRRLNLHIEPCLPQELGVVRVRLVFRPRLPPPVAAARAIVAHAPPPARDPRVR